MKDFEHPMRTWNRPPWRRLATLSLLGLVASAGSCSGGGPARPDIVVIVMDTVRPDFLSAYGHPRPTTPFLEELARQGTRFDRAYSTSCWTLPSHASLFTGTLPKTHRAHQLELRVADSLPVLAERLSEAGYQTAGFSNNTWISDRSGLDRGFEHFENYISSYRAHLESLANDPEGQKRPAAEHQTVQAVRAWIESTRDPERPHFVFVNVVEPHLPYLPPWQQASHFMGARSDRWSAIQRHYPDAKGTRLIQRHYDGTFPLSEDEWNQLRSMYEGELRMVDAVVARIVEALDAVSDPENTLVFVLSDHGENFGEHGHATHILNVYDSNLRIPLIARGPDFPAGTTRGDLVQITDLYSTILASVGLLADDHAVGLDLRRPGPPDRIVLASLEEPEVSRRVFSEEMIAAGKLRPYERELRAAIGARLKLIVASDGSEELYDLVADPGEVHPLDPNEVDATELARLRAAVRDAIGQPAATGAGGDWDDAAALDDIKAMGYADSQD